MRKLGRTADARMAMLRTQASELLWYGRLETTVDRAKEVRGIAEEMITLAMDTYTDTVAVTKTVTSKSTGVKEQREFTNDGVKKLNARRKMMSVLRDLHEERPAGEKMSVFKERTKDVNHPLIEKLFNEHAPFYAKRAEACGQRGGYTRIIRLGNRRGDNAEVAIIELVKDTPAKK